MNKIHIRHLVCVVVLLILGSTSELHAQQPGPIADVGTAEENASSDSFFPLWKSLLGERKSLPPYGVNLVLFDLSGQWDVKNFSAALGNNELVSVKGQAQVHPLTYGVRADVWVFPFLNVFTTFGGVKLNVQATGYDLPLGVSGIPPEVIRGDVNLDLDLTGYYGGGGVSRRRRGLGHRAAAGVRKNQDQGEEVDADHDAEYFQDFH